MRAGETECCGRQKKQGGYNRALLPRILEQLHARQQEECEAEKQGANSAKSKGPNHLPTRGIREGRQQYQDAESQQHCIAAK
jgi:hypothetical protein